MPTFCAYIMFYMDLFLNAHLKQSKTEHPKHWVREVLGCREIADVC